MMKAAAVEMGKILSPVVVEANKNNIDDNGISQLPTRRAALHPYIASSVTRSMTLAVTFSPPNRPQPQQLKLRSNFSSNEIIIDEGEGDEEEHVSESEWWLESVNTNPCVDLLRFVDAELQSSYRQTSPYTQRASASTHKYLTQLLPLAWSHNPLTTLKLILYLGDNIDDYEVFYTALLWLHHNHPKTLASNIEPFVGDYSATHITEIIYRLVLLQGISTQHSDSDNVRHRIRDKTIAIANKAAEMYQSDPDFQFLHDKVSDFFVDRLKSDIENLKKNQTNGDGDGDDAIVFSMAAGYLPYTGYRAATQLCESIARKLFPQEKEEAVRRSRLKKEVLLPVRKMSCHGMIFSGRKREIMQYLEDVKAGCCEIKIDHGDEPNTPRLLPHEVIRYADDPDLGDVAQLHWKAMVEDLFNKGKWKNCLAVRYKLDRTYPQFQHVSMAFVLLFSQLSEQPWKGKAISLDRYPGQLRMIQGSDDLNSQCTFLRGMDCHGKSCCLMAVFDLILQEAVNTNLKPEHMIKKVLVFTSHASSLSSKDDSCWPSIIREIRSKFEDKGYGNAVPHIVVWAFWWTSHVDPPSRLPGVTFLTGYTDAFSKLFLDNEGEVGPEHAVEATICGKRYSNMAVVD